MGKSVPPRRRAKKAKDQKLKDFDRKEKKLERKVHETLNADQIKVRPLWPA
jgi:hypothetical protein